MLVKKFIWVAGGLIASLLVVLALWIGVGIIKWDSSMGEAAAKYAAIPLIPIGIIGGILISIWKEDKRRWKEDKKKWEEEKRGWEEKKKRQLDAQQRIDVLDSKLRELARLISKASVHLYRAEREFEEKAFSPFLDRVEKVINVLTEYSKRVNKIQRNTTKHAHHYSRLGISVPNILQGKLPDARPVAWCLWIAIRQAQRDNQFVMFYERKRTNQILDGGNGTLEDFDSILILIEKALVDLASSLNTTLEDLVP